MSSGPDPRRVLIVATHPVQYAAPLFRRMARDPRLDVTVAYLSMAGAEPSHDPGFGSTVQWDVPLLDGYSWVEAPSPRALFRIVRGRPWTAVICHTGYRRLAFWIALTAARLSATPYLFGTDAHGLEPRTGGQLRPLLKRLVLPYVFGLADVALAPSSPTRDFLLRMGLDPHRVALTPYVVDNDWWTTQAAAADRYAIRAEWGVPDQGEVILFAAKLQPWKRPLELLSAFAQLRDRSHVVLVYAGEGPQRGDLERAARAAGVSSRVRFLGFVNQSRLPAVYRASDVFVLPSQYEPFGVVVNEAMLCGCAVVVSDRVGAARDLIEDGKSGLVYPSGDDFALAAALRRLTGPASSRDAIAEGGRTRISQWSPESNLDATVEAIDRAAFARSRRPPETTP